MSKELEDCDKLCAVHQEKAEEFSQRSTDVRTLFNKIDKGWKKTLDDLPNSMWSEQDTETLKNLLDKSTFNLNLSSAKFASEHSDCMGECQRKRWEEVQKLYGKK